MHSSNLGLHIWGIALYILTTNIKGTSSMKLRRDVKVTQKTAWHLAHRIRETWHYETTGKFYGPVEVDETYIGGKEKNKHTSKSRGDPFSGGRMRFIGVDMERMPIAPAKPATKKRLSALASEIQTAKEADPRAATASSEREIDEIVYALYGLDERDIALIEKAAPS